MGPPVSELVTRPAAELVVLADLVELLRAAEEASAADDPGMRFFSATTREYVESLRDRMTHHDLTIAEVTVTVRAGGGR